MAFSEPDALHFIRIRWLQVFALIIIHKETKQFKRVFIKNKTKYHNQLIINTKKSNLKLKKSFPGGISSYFSPKKQIVIFIIYIPTLPPAPALPCFRRRDDYRCRQPPAPAAGSFQNGRKIDFPAGFHGCGKSGDVVEMGRRVWSGRRAAAQNKADSRCRI